MLLGPSLSVSTAPAKLDSINEKQEDRTENKLCF